MHVLKDERSTISYGYDEFSYRLYYYIEKKLIKSLDVVFMKDQTINGIDKV